MEEKNKQLELEHQIMEKKIHLEVSELETKLKDAHMIIEIEDDCKKNLQEMLKYSKKRCNWKMSTKKWRSKSLSWVGDVSGSLINSPA